MDLKEILVAAILPAVDAVISSKISDVLDKVKEHNTAEVYEQGVRGIHAGFKLLATVTNQTKTKIDDNIVETILATVADHATANGVILE